MERISSAGKGREGFEASPESSPPSRSWQHVGAHLFQFVSPDLLELQLVGDISPHEMELMGDVFSRFVREASWVVLSADVSRLGDIPAETRRSAFEVSGIWLFHGGVVWGASFAQRLICATTWNAVRMLRRGQHAPHLASVETEAQAQAWVDEQRRQQQARATP
ncbi:hypothetical protein [Chondromyces crocatus]|uniref:hypothetical protein n=1 Tax=Chondromyces crocatus TaxID=52 RepID=UPI00067D2DFF|nr:hypothetical protein [Chondromyces crocatus]